MKKLALAALIFSAPIFAHPFEKYVPEEDEIERKLNLINEKLEELMIQVDHILNIETEIFEYIEEKRSHEYHEAFTG